MPGLRAAEKSPADYAKDLVSSDNNLKREAAYQLSRPGVDAREALPALIKALEDSQQQVWFGAVTALANLGPAAEPALPALWKELEDWEPFRRERTGQQSLYRTAVALGAIGPAALESLTQGLSHAKWHVRAGSAMALGFAGSIGKPAIPALVTLLEDSRPEVRDACSETLAHFGADALGPLRDALGKDESPARREGAALTLGRMGVQAAPAVTDLQRAFAGDREVKVRQASLQSLARLRRSDPEVVALLLRVWTADEPSVQETAAKELLLVRPPAPSLLALLASDLRGTNNESRLRAAKMVRQMGRDGAEAVGPLVRTLALEAEDSAIEEAFAGAVAGVGPSALPQVFAELAGVPVAKLGSNHWSVRVLRRMDASAVAPLSEALTHPSPSVRAGALEALEAKGDAARLKARTILPLLRDPEPSVRRRAWLAAAACGADPEALLKALETALKDEHPEVRRAAVMSVSRLGRAGREAVPTLVELLNGPDPESREVAVAALGTLGVDAGEAAGALAGRLAEATGESRLRVLQALGDMGPSASAALPALVACLGETDATFRRLTLEVLGRLKESAKPALPSVFGMLGDGQPAVRAAAVRALVQIDPGAEGVLTTMVSSLEDSEAVVRHAAAESIAKVGDRGRPAEPLLFGMLQDAEDRPFARDALRAIQPATLSLLMTALGHDDVGVRQMAADALARLGKSAGEAVGALERLVREDPSEDVKRACRRAIRRIRES